MSNDALVACMGICGRETLHNRPGALIQQRLIVQQNSDLSRGELLGELLRNGLDIRKVVLPKRFPNKRATRTAAGARGSKEAFLKYG